MEKLRQHDKDIYLNAFLTLISTLPEDVQIKVAEDILGEIPKAVSNDTEGFMKLIQERKPNQDKRWYDKNDRLRAVVKAIKELKDDERAKLYDDIDAIINRNI